ncbi:MAG: hypothetical protein R3C97_09570 [Geminicoccaceae bacterium]
MWPRGFRISGVTLTVVAAMVCAADLSLAEEDVNKIIERLERISEEQKKALEGQSRMIEKLRQRIDQMENRATTELKENLTAPPNSGDLVKSEFVHTNRAKGRLTISGQINRAINVADDGDDTKAYFIDNDASNSRIRADGEIELPNSALLGTNFELAFSPNNSYDVSQESESSDDFTDVRKVDVYLHSNQLGKLSFGKGSAATDGTAENDLSLIGSIMYSGVADVVGGLFFQDNAGSSAITVGDAFFNFDGGRQNRIRYDTPMLGDLVQVSVSAGEDQKYDAAISWGGDFDNWTGVTIGPLTTLGAVGIQDPSDPDIDYRLTGSFSVIHDPTGLSLTLSGGADDRDGSDPYNVYSRLAWDTALSDVGPTSVGIDWTYNEDTVEEGSKGTSVGLAALQSFDGFGAEIYGAIRLFDFERGDGDDPDNVYVGTVGTRVKF